MESLLPFVIGIILLFIAYKFLKGIVKTLGVLVAVAIAAALYFYMGGVAV